MKNRLLTKQRIIEEIKRIANQSGGKSPGIGKFEKITGIKRSQWESFWRYWLSALKEAGCEPNRFGTPAYETENLLECLARLTRKLEKLPALGDIKFARIEEPSFPTISTFKKRASQGEWRNLLSKWVQDKEEYQDVALIIASSTSSPARKIQAKKENSEEKTISPALSDSFVPPVIECLPRLAKADSAMIAYLQERGVNQNVEFEKRVAIAFRMLGLSVKRLGQGSGRVADGIAKCMQDGWAVVYDTKVRVGGYRIETEDRKFKEYIDNHSPELRAEGIAKLYFAIISHSFTEDDLSKTKEIVRQTQAKSCVLFEAEALLKLVMERIKQPVGFEFADVERVFMETRIVVPSDISTRQNGEI